VVFGLLQTDGTIDTKRTKELVQLAYPMEVTFHRAFDRVKDPHQSLEDVIACGCTRILTSGLRPTAMEGVSLIRELIELAEARIIVDARIDIAAVGEQVQIGRDVGADFGFDTLVAGVGIFAGRCGLRPGLPLLRRR